MLAWPLFLLFLFNGQAGTHWFLTYCGKAGRVLLGEETYGGLGPFYSAILPSRLEE